MKYGIKALGWTMAGVLLLWFPVALLSEIGHDPITGARPFHPIGTPFFMLKRLLELPLWWTGPDRPINSAVCSFGVYLVFWTLAIWGCWMVARRILKIRNEKA